ncbi:MAG: molecular chaperone HtpG [Melioribacteraceae bacterium]|nr:molecular chaperone HtpG [Melioribacteraceae bacterium]
MSKENLSGHHEFKAEVKQLLNILVHSLYTNKEIFLRELVSNASDALDKLRFESNKGSEIIDNDQDLEIKIAFDKEKGTLTITDTGIGMTAEEIVKNIGTIAKSGSADFIKQLSDSKEDANNIIGKFGVGFYSVFMIASEVTLKTKSFKKDEKAVMWTSDGLGSYDLVELESDKKRGTEVIITLKEEEKEFADKHRIEHIIKTHSNFISFPIKVEDEVVNTVSAIWREPKSSVTKEQYDEFYKFLTLDYTEPMETIHRSVDAPIQFNSLLFIPKKNMDMFGFNRDDYGLDLYVRRVLIQHKNKDLLPEYLSFVKGVVDSEDLPLNISRETLQENLVFTKISSSVTSTVLNYLEKLSKDDKEKFAELWREHGKVFKLGYSDYANQEKYSALLRFNSSRCEDAKGLVSFDEYIENAKEDQKEIYYLAGSSREAVELDPHLEIFKTKGIEVLFFLEPVDEFAVSAVPKYKEFELKSVDQADLSKLDKFESEKVEDKSEEMTKDDEKSFDKLLKRIQNILGDRVTDVKESKRLKDSPACLVNPDDSMSASMQKMMQMMNKDASVPKKIFEINKNHKLVRNLIKIYNKNAEDDYIITVVEQLYESSLLLEGYLTDPHKLVGRINKLLENSSDWYTEINK